MRQLFLCLLFTLLLHTSGLPGEQSGKKEAHHFNSATAHDSEQRAVVVPDVLTREMMRSLVLQHNPSLSAGSAEIQAYTAAITQAGAFPNPELDAELENFGGDKSAHNFEAAELTIGVSQLVELGGKRQTRRKIAEYDKKIAESSFQIKKRNVLAAAAMAFTEVLVAQEQVILVAELLQIAEKTTTAVSEKVDAGKISPIEKSRVQIELATARADTVKAAHALDAARHRLAGFWGDDHARFIRVTGDLHDKILLPKKDTLLAMLSRNPEFIRSAAETKRQRAILSRERKTPLPDLTVMAGIRNSRESDEQSFVAGVSVPLPLFDRNIGALQEAHANLDKFNDLRRATKYSLHSEFSSAWEELSAAHTDAVSIRDEILPAATTTYEATVLGYREGKFDLLKMIDAQRTLFMIKNRYLSSLASYHFAAAKMECLTGSPTHTTTVDTGTIHYNKESRK